MTIYEHITALREALGGRRYLMTIGAGVVNTLLVVHGHIPASVYESLITLTVGFYIAGNGAQRFIDKKFGGASAQQPNS